MSKKLSWGECLVLCRKYADENTKGTQWLKFDTPVSESTQLETTEGDKTEALVEGGELEAVRRAKNKYNLSFEVRMGAGYKPTLSGADGIIEGEYEVMVYPVENPTAPSIYIPRASANKTTSYSSADGNKEKYSFDALTNDTGFGQCIWGTAVMGSGDLPSSFTALEDASAENLI